MTDQEASAEGQVRVGETMPGSKAINYVVVGARVLAALILGQTLFFKFSASPESVYIFETLGVEPWGRIGSGVLEAVAVILLLAPVGKRGLARGAVLTVGLMGGAVGSHLTQLGIEVQGDGGTLFALAVVTLLCGLFLSWTQRRTLLQLLNPGKGAS
jgi:putative oxidoreductase